MASIFVQERAMDIKTLKQAAKATIPVMTGYLFLGVAFGILLQERGYNAWWALLMSGLIYAGSMQFVAVGLLAGPFSILQAVLVTLSVNARHLFYGLSMITRFKGMGKRKPYMIFSLTDETYSLLCAPLPAGVEDREGYYFWVALLDQCYWIAGSVLGGLCGRFLPFDSTGIDFAMTALFIVIFVEQWEAAKTHIPALAGVGISVLCLLVFGAERFIIPAMLLILAVLFALRGRIGGGASRAA